MEKYKVLLTGRNTFFIDDCFNQMKNEFILMSSSERYEDLDNHLEFFNPDIIIVGLEGETKEDIAKYAQLKRKLARNEVYFIIAGNKEECEEFQKGAVYLADEEIHKPLDAISIKSKLLDHIDELKREKEENKKLLEALDLLKDADRRKHVLVIDDDPLMLKLIKEYLHDKYDVATAVSGKIAYKFLENKKTDLILLDYEMPGENGPIVLENLRKNSNLGSTPVLFLTGITDREKIKHAISLKPQGYMLKPIDREKLLGTIEKFIG